MVRKFLQADIIFFDLCYICVYETDAHVLRAHRLRLCLRLLKSQICEDVLAKEIRGTPRAIAIKEREVYFYPGYHICL